MNTIKTLFLSALLSAAAYGVYVAVTGVSPLTIRKEPQKDWEAGPQVVLSEEAADEPAVIPTVAPPGTEADAHGLPPAAATGQAAFDQTAPPSQDHGAADGAAAHADPAAMASAVGQYPPTDRYPSTDADPAAQRYPPSDRYASDNRYPPDGRYPSTDDVPGGSVYGDTPAANAEGDLHAQFTAAMQSAEASLAQGHLAEGHLELSEWYGEPSLTPDEERQLVALLDQLAGTVIYSRQHLVEPPYDVQPGDTLERIADQYQVPWQLLANINGIRDPQHLRQGERLKVIRGPFDAVVNLKRFELVLSVDGRYAGRFRIGIGDQPTPDGDFVVLGKVVNPTYYGHAVIDANDPNNPLGEYALDLGNGVLIHGTNDPQSIGRTDSRGWVCLAERDIKDLFEILTAKSDRSPGSRVSLRHDAQANPPGPAGPSEPAVARAPGR